MPKLWAGIVLFAMCLEDTMFYGMECVLLGIGSCHCNNGTRAHIKVGWDITKFVACVFAEILRRKQEIWDLGQEPFQPERCTDGFFGEIVGKVTHFWPLGYNGREDQAASSLNLERFGMIWAFWALQHFPLGSTTITGPSHSHNLAQRWAEPQDSSTWKKHRSTTPSSSMYLRCSEWGNPVMPCYA